MGAMLLIFKPFPGAVFGTRDRETEAMGRPYCFFQELQHGNSGVGISFPKLWGDHSSFSCVFDWFIRYREMF
jgi:hypothetical protein